MAVVKFIVILIAQVSSIRSEVVTVIVELLKWNRFLLICMILLLVLPAALDGDKRFGLYASLVRSDLMAYFFINKKSKKLWKLISIMNNFSFYGRSKSWLTHRQTHQNERYKFWIFDCIVAVWQLICEVSHSTHVSFNKFILSHWEIG